MLTQIGVKALAKSARKAGASPSVAHLSASTRLVPSRQAAVIIRALIGVQLIERRRVAWRWTRQWALCSKTPITRSSCPPSPQTSPSASAGACWQTTTDHVCCTHAVCLSHMLLLLFASVSHIRNGLILRLEAC